jgi:hypothetical protein
VLELIEEQMRDVSSIAIFTGGTERRDRSHAEIGVMSSLPVVQEPRKKIAK